MCAFFQPDPPGQRSMKVLKDQNFLEEMLDFGKLLANVTFFDLEWIVGPL
jgi:hypothetical protein